MVWVFGFEILGRYEIATYNKRSKTSGETAGHRTNMRRFIKEQNSEEAAIFEKVWQNGVIVFDTNVLLNLYRYNKEARNELIKLMKSYQSRLWIPYQIGLEFMANCETVKAWIHKGFKDLSTQVDECKKSFFMYFDKNYSKHKHINRKELEQLFDQQMQPIKDKLVEWEKSIPDYDKKDVVKNKIVELYDQKVGTDYNYDELLEIYAKGKTRYDNKIPPGYKDATKEKWEMGVRHVFGDLIAWMQIMDYAKANDKDVIFVGEDLKEDWWEKNDGKLNKPRQELLDEFKYRTGREIVFHTQKGFIEASKKKLKEETLKEIERVREENMRFLEQLRIATESISPFLTRFDYPALGRISTPSFEEIQKLATATAPNMQAFQQSLKSIQDHANIYTPIFERIRELSDARMLSMWSPEKSDK